MMNHRRFLLDGTPTFMRSIDLQLYDKQFEFVTADENYLGIFGGIGSGKSQAGAVRSLLATQGQIGSQRVPVPNLGVVTAPTYTMLRDATMRTFFDVAGNLVAKHNKSDYSVTMRNGSEVLFRSTSEPERLRGPNATWAWMDEAALSPAEAWKIVIGRLRQHGLFGWAWLTTTPKGRNWIWQRFVKEQLANYRKIKTGTRENPFLSEDFIASLEREYTGDFAKQELLGDFVAFEGLIYPEFDRDRHIIAYQPDRKFKYVVGGIDWGFANPGVMLVGGVDADDRIHIVHEDYERRRRVEEWATLGAQLSARWGVQTWFADPSEPDYIRICQEAGMKVEAANNSVNTGIQVVKNRLVVWPDGSPRIILMPDAVWTASEFEQYQWLSNRDGLRDAPKKANDHSLDALRYLCMGVEEMASASVAGLDVTQWAG